MELEKLITKKIGLSHELYERLINLSDKVLLQKKDFLLQQGKVCTFIGFVESGVLRSFIEKEGEDYISDFYFQGSFTTSYRSFLQKEASVGSIQALEDSTVFCLSKSNYDLLLQESGEWYKLGKHIADTLFIRKCRKETSLLMDSALDRYKLLLQTYPHIEQSISQYHIASYLGIKPESLSRLKSLNIGQ
ncbi:Crp/Fnr family transcriptional regulator [Bacteroides reticulotermitis]|uniref:cAMP-binding proteins n=2 Tax=Bacteroides reticulotermitis TaxID=1133319 RepID=W4UV99_9BACE|nr:Crp/Fnr family transcriptional regulator [Bacteroides reticulotermitis]MBB4045611.1 CRP-like cAMP-binding protein [Bacteroides reticulotermitis]GAE84414.1 cAMP-binding proteins [Bacteroides reticulotermitis JCM 10512]HJD75754.1 Crp/Fnr family transcriptional regulator [Bacteroides reticulotermitis]